MKKFAAFINTDTIKDLKFVEMKLVGDKGEFAELTKEPKGVSATIYTNKLNLNLDWENNMRRLQKEPTFKRSYSDYINVHHLNELCEYYADGEKYSIEWHFIDIDFRNMVDEIYFYLNQNLVQYDTHERLATAV